MNRIPRATIALTVIALLGACAADTGTSTHYLVDKAATEAEVFYIDTGISDAPLTLSELGESAACATPVRIRFTDELAIAYHAPEGEPILDEDHIVAVWQIIEHAEPLDDELESGDTVPPLVAPAPQYPTPELDYRLDMNPVSNPARNLMRRGVNAPYARIDWLRQHFQDMMRLPPGSHPGC
jgi:hypothetical protein